MAKLKLKTKKAGTASLRGFQMIEALDVEVRDFVDQMIYDGESDYSIRLRLLNEYEVLTEKGERTIDRAIEKYRQTEPALKRQEALSKEEAATSVRRFDKDVDVLTELQRVTLMQRERLDKALEKERGSPLPLEMVGKEMATYRSLLQDCGKLQLEMGIIQKAPKKVTGLVPGADGKPVQFSWREEQEQLLAVLDHASTD